MLVGYMNRKLMVYRHLYVNNVRKLYKTYHNIVPFHVQRSVDIFIICCWRGIFSTNFCALDISSRSYPSLYSLPVHLFFFRSHFIFLSFILQAYIYIFLAILVNVTLYIVRLKCSTLEADMFTYIPLTLNFRSQSEVALQIC